MRKGAILILAVLLGGCASARPSLRDPYHVAAMGAAAADVTTTKIGLSRPNVEEANSVATAICGEDMDLGCMIGMKAGMVLAMAWIENVMELDGWEKRILWLLPVGLWGGVSVWNATVIW